MKFKSLLCYFHCCKINFLKKLYQADIYHKLPSFTSIDKSKSLLQNKFISLDWSACDKCLSSITLRCGSRKSRFKRTNCHVEWNIAEWLDRWSGVHFKPNVQSPKIMDSCRHPCFERVHLYAYLGHIVWSSKVVY